MDVDALAQSWRKRMAATEASRAAAAERVRAAASRAAKALRDEFDAAEVWLFGSLVDGPRHDAFDVDLAVRGVKPERYFAALARVWEIVERPVDLVTLETCPEGLRRSVLERGVRLDGG